MDSSNLDEIYRNLILQDNQAEVLNLLLLEFIFLQMKEQLMLHQDLKYPLDSSCIFFHSSSKNENVVQVDNYNTFCYKVLEDVVHHYLEYGWTVSHTKKYYQQLKQSMVGMEHGLPFISGLDMYIVETPANIKLGEILGSTKL